MKTRPNCRPKIFAISVPRPQRVWNKTVTFVTLSDDDDDNFLWQGQPERNQVSSPRANPGLEFNAGGSWQAILRQADHQAALSQSLYWEKEYRIFA